MTDAAPLRLTGVGKRYGTRDVLKDLSLEVEAGELVVITGPNGAGKSTLLGCVCGTVSPDAGAVEIAGHDLAAAPIEARRKLRYLPQELEMPRAISGREWLEFHADVYGDRAALARLVEHPLLRALGPALDNHATTLSPGQRRRLAFVTTLPGQAALIVLDEPFAGVDRPGQEAMRAEIRDALGRGRGVLLSAHDAEEPAIAALVQAVPKARVVALDVLPQS